MLRHPVTALTLSVALFASVAVVSHQVEGEPAGTRLPLPAVGEADATYLDDGAPVFVVHHVDGGVSVLSAINPHLNILAAWCPSARIFEEPGPASRWDEYGHWLSGPAPRGLTPYEHQMDGEQVVVGARAEPPGRDVPPYAPAGPMCDWDVSGPPTAMRETILDSAAHDLDDFGAPLDPGETEPGRLQRLSVRVAVADGEARLCAPRDESGCGERSWPVRSFFHDDWPWPTPEHCTGQVDGEALARRIGLGFTDLALLAGYAGPASYDGGAADHASVSCDWEFPWADQRVEGLLVDVVREGGRWVLVLEDGRRHPTHPVLRYAVETWFAREEREPGARMPQTHYRVEDLPGLLDERGPMEVELDVVDDGSAAYVSFWEMGSRPF